MKKLIITSLVIFFINSTFAQLVVNPNQTAQQLVQNVLIGSGVSVSNITNQSTGYCLEPKSWRVVEKALDDVGALDLFDKQIGSLSGGELQKVFIARAMVSNPNILLLDEPVTGIDLICETKINSAIRRINNEADATVIMVTHDISAAYDHSELILMLNKKQIYFGSKENAFTDENLRHTFSASSHHHGAVLELKTEGVHEH